MNPNQPPQGFFGAGHAAPPPPPPRRKAGAVILILALAAFVLVLGLVSAGAFLWLGASDAEPIVAGGQAVPADGKRHYAIRWQVESSPTDVTLRGVWVSGPTAHVVGDGGVILTRDSAGAWSLQRSGTKANLHAVASTAAGMMAVGDEGTAVVFDRTSRTWNREDTGTKAPLRALVRVGREVFAVGGKGTIVRRSADGTWSTEPSPVQSDLHALSTPEPSHTANRELYAAGADGTILFRASESGSDKSPSPWVAQSSGVKTSLTDLTGVSRTLFGVGEGGVALRLQTAADAPWAREAMPGAPDLFAVGTSYVPFQLRRQNYHQSGSEPCWIVAGKGGFVALRPRKGAEPWTVVEPRPTTHDLLAASHDPQSNLILVGEGGVIVSSRTDSF